MLQDEDLGYCDVDFKKRDNIILFLQELGLQNIDVKVNYLIKQLLGTNDAVEAVNHIMEFFRLRGSPIPGSMISVLVCIFFKFPIQSRILAFIYFGCMESAMISF